LVRKVVLMISGSSLNVGHLGKKLGHTAKIKKNLVNTLVAAVFILIFWKFVKNVVLMISKSSSKMGHFRSKTRSQELKIEKACKHSKGCTFHLNILEICQEGCLDDI
jgi:hypothetical protein